MCNKGRQMFPCSSNAQKFCKIQKLYLPTSPNIVNMLYFEADQLKIRPIPENSRIPNGNQTKNGSSNASWIEKVK